MHFAYSGVHENMCIMHRPFAIEKVRSWGVAKEDVAVIRDLAYPIYNP